MKKSDWILAVSTLVYSYLFYQQASGINFLLFNCLLAASLAILHPAVLKKPIWFLFAGASILTSFFIFWHHSDLAVFANISSLLLLSAYTIKSNASLLLNAFYSVYSIAGSYVFIILNSVKKYDSTQAVEKKKKPVNLIIGLIVLVIAIVFFFIYKNANPLFAKYTEKINLDFISFAWIAFTLAGFFIMYGFFKHQRIKSLDVWEDGLPVVLSNKGDKARTYEKTAGIWLFVLLNIMLLFINALDVVYLYILKQLPEGITHTQFVHNGVGMLILSIVLGIAIILFLFRGAINFDENNKWVKALVAIWIIQNAMMIFSTCVRNYIYVDEYNLTYKRIGVFIYLLLALTGLSLTLFKILYKRSNWFLIKSNAFAFFLILVVSSFINWDEEICAFNISRKANELKRLDKKYLAGLSEAAIPYLQQLKEKPGFNTDSAYSDLSLFGELRNSYSRNGSVENSWLTDIKTYNFLKYNAGYPGWQSYNHRSSHILNELYNMNAGGSIKSLTLYGQELDSMNLLSLFNNAEKLDLSSTRNSGLGFLNSYSKLKELDLSGGSVNSIAKIPALPSLQTLTLRNDNLYTIEGIASFPVLTQLDISENNISNVAQLPPGCKLITINASGNRQLKDLRGLAKATELETLVLNNCNNLEYFPALNKLKDLDISHSIGNTNYILNLIPHLPSLESLSIQHNTGTNLTLLRKFDNQTKQNQLKFPHLKKLSAYSCSISDASVLSEFSELEIIQLNNNELTEAAFVSSLSSIQELSLANNKIKAIVFTENNKSIEKLNLSNNNISDFSSLHYLIKLEYLNVAGTGITDLSMLKCQSSLKEICINNTKLNYLSMLLPFKQLEIIHINQILENETNLLKKLPSLKTMYLNSAYTSETDLTKLKTQFPTIKFYTE